MFRSAIHEGSLIAVAISLGLSACATTPILKPEPGDALAPGTKNAVEASTAGVQMLVDGDLWNGDPADLGQLFIPVKVTIQNRSGRSLRVSYADFSLSGLSGSKYAAIPPMSAKSEISMASTQDTVPAEPALFAPTVHFHLMDDAHLTAFNGSPRLTDWYPGWQGWPYSYPYDPFFYDGMSASWPEQLPTQDMLSKALPEGEVQNGGNVEGFVYFQEVGTRESSVTFGMNLVDATTGQQFAQLSIPFAVGK